MTAQPQKGDLVRVTYEAEYLRLTDDGDHHVVTPTREGYPFRTPLTATLEIVRPVDDPSKSTAGAVRRSPGGIVVVHNGDEDPSPWYRIVNGTDNDEDDLYFSHSDVTGWEKLEPMPGTPAAGKVTDLSEEVVAEARRLARDNQKIRAIKLVRQYTIDHDLTGHPCRGLREAKEFVESLAALWIGDGSVEPPAHVTKVRDRHGDDLIRSEEFWQGDGTAWTTRKLNWHDGARSPENCGPWTEIVDL